MIRDADPSVENSDPGILKKPSSENGKTQLQNCQNSAQNQKTQFQKWENSVFTIIAQREKSC